MVKFTIRIHTGNRTEEQQREAIQQAAQQFFKEIQKERKTDGSKNAAA